MDVLHGCCEGGCGGGWGDRGGCGRQGEVERCDTLWRLLTGTANGRRRHKSAGNSSTHTLSPYTTDSKYFLADMHVNPCERKRSSDLLTRLKNSCSLQHGASVTRPSPLTLEAALWLGAFSRLISNSGHVRIKFLAFFSSFYIDFFVLFDNCMHPPYGMKRREEAVPTEQPQ